MEAPYFIHDDTVSVITLTLPSPPPPHFSGVADLFFHLSRLEGENLVNAHIVFVNGGRAVNGLNPAGE